VTADNPTSILPIVAGKPGSRGESPLRQALDVMEDRERGQLLKDLDRSIRTSGFAATVQDCRLIVESGRELTLTGIDQTARRIV
jgi:hypothetical protein